MYFIHDPLGIIKRMKKKVPILSHPQAAPWVFGLASHTQWNLYLDSRIVWSGIGYVCVCLCVCVYIKTLKVPWIWGDPGGVISFNIIEIGPIGIFLIIVNWNKLYLQSCFNSIWCCLNIQSKRKKIKNECEDSSDFRQNGSVSPSEEFYVNISLCWFSSTACFCGHSAWSPLYCVESTWVFAFLLGLGFSSGLCLPNPQECSRRAARGVVGLVCAPGEGGKIRLCIAHCPWYPSARVPDEGEIAGGWTQWILGSHSQFMHFWGVPLFVPYSLYSISLNGYFS